ncbi:MAG: helix-turn-helix domain-containing protein [Deltaproteobacteria bacterium]|nr:helix-turn-helix domain-containing protein [Deltaproteobacteria bacterium]
MSPRAGKREGGHDGAAVRKLVAVGAGKGGSGVSMFAANLAMFLAQIGKKVALVDANLAEAGLHAWLGLPRPERTVADVLHGRVARAEDALVETRVGGLMFLAGSDDPLLCARAAAADLERLARGIREIDVDFVVVDLPAGLHDLTLGLFADADLPIAVTSATPDSVESTYRLIRGAFLHALVRASRDDGRSFELLDAMIARPGRPPAAREVAAALEGAGSPLSFEAARLAGALHPLLVVNQTKVKSDLQLGDAMVSAAARWMGLTPRFLGSLEWDDNVWLSLRRGQPLVIDYAQTRACKDLERLVRRLLGQDMQDLLAPAPMPQPTENQNLYELLEIYPGASDEEVRRALKRVRDDFGAGSLAVRGACTEAERADYQRRSEEAHARLLDPARRRQYDRQTFPEGFPRPKAEGARAEAAGAKRRAASREPEVVVGGDQIMDGPFLGRLRREKGIELADISARAKISVTYLKAIEEERFPDLPAPVYVRGYVTELARYLKVDPGRAVRDFMNRLESSRRRRGKV